MKNNGTFWTVKDDNEILQFSYITSYKIKYLAKYFGRSFGAVRDRCKYLGVEICRNGKTWSEHETEYLKNNYKNKTYYEISIFLKRSESSVRAKALSIGLKKEGKKAARLHSNKKWTHSEDLILKKYCETGEWEEKLNRSISAIHNRKYLLNLKLSKKALNKLGRLSSKNRGLHVYNNYKKILGTTIKHYYNGAKVRGINTYLLNGSFENLKYLNDIANETCAISGIKIKYPERAKDQNATASLDRIDSSKGYIKGNVQWVHKDVNRMKMKMDQDYFIYICKEISKNAK